MRLERFKSNVATLVMIAGLIDIHWLNESTFEAFAYAT
jgi:hypothetical protein